MNVLSLFDGMSCGRIALDRLGIKVDNYYASEIDKYAMKVSEANYPDIIQVGDVTQLDTSTLPKIDLVMGGSPCQGFSVAGKGLAFDDPRSALFFEFVRCVKELKPKYFLLENVNMKKEYLNIITEYMGVEGIKINSALVSAQNRQRWYWTNITGIEQPEQRGIVLRDILEGDAEEPMYSNIYGGFGEKKPREHFDKSVTIRANSGGGSIPNVKLKDFDKNLARMTTKEGKAYCLTASYQAAVPHNSLARSQRSMIPVITGGALRARSVNADGKNVAWKETKPKQMLELRKDDKSNAISSVTKDSVVVTKPNQINPSKKEYISKKSVEKYVEDVNSEFNDPYNKKTVKGDKSTTLRTNSSNGNMWVNEKAIKEINEVVSTKPNQINPSKKEFAARTNVGKLPEKSQTIKSQYYKSSKANFERQGTFHATGVQSVDLTWRKLTPVECERLQTVPDNYTNHVSNTQRYKMLGNGWTIEVVCHILKKIKDDI